MEWGYPLILQMFLERFTPLSPSHSVSGTLSAGRCRLPWRESGRGYSYSSGKEMCLILARQWIWTLRSWVHLRVCWSQDGVMWSWQYSPVASAEWDAALLSRRPGWISLNGLHRCGFWGGKLFQPAPWWSNTVSHWNHPDLHSIGESMSLIQIHWKRYY